MTNSLLPTTTSVPRRSLSLAASLLWQWLRRPWLAIIATLIGLILALAAWQLPQLPGQLVDEHAAAATWLLNTSAGYGIWGNAFLALGLFHVLRSPLLYLLVALLVPTLATHLADQLGALRQQRTVQTSFASPPADAPGTALPLANTRQLFRWRGLAPTPARDLIAAFDERLRTLFDTVERAKSPLSAVEGNAHNVEDSLDVGSAEVRLLGLRRARMVYIRPLLMVGLLMSVAGAWIALAFGWQVASPPLAPGATFRSANRNLLLHYSVSAGEIQTVVLEAALQGTRMEMAVAEPVRRRIGAATLQAQPAFPAVWIAVADGSEQLILPAENKLRPQVGLVFANPGSEESVLLPNLVAGLRIVQRAGSDSFVLELYRSDADQPVYRAELTPGGQLTIPLAPDDLELLVSSLPGLQVDVRHLPGLWLVPLGIFLALIGAIAYARPSAFVLLQIAPWQAENSIVVIQSDHLTVVSELRAHLSSMALPLDREAPLPDEPPALSQTEPRR